MTTNLSKVLLLLMLIATLCGCEEPRPQSTVTKKAYPPLVQVGNMLVVKNYGNDHRISELEKWLKDNPDKEVKYVYESSHYHDFYVVTGPRDEKEK